MSGAFRQLSNLGRNKVECVCVGGVSAKYPVPKGALVLGGILK